MALALFDLDNTLLAGDSDYLWGCFLAERGIVDKASYEQENQRFMDDYNHGTLDIFEFLAFSLKPLRDNDPEILRKLQHDFLQQKIRPIMSPASFQLIEKHRQSGDTLAVITATNSFVTAPITEAFGIEHLLATEPEKNGQRFTGRVAGTPCFQGGKVTRVKQWIDKHGLELKDSWFYSDSHNDIPLLNVVDHPVAVDPDPELRKLAERNDWPIISLRSKFS